jgi:plasmid stabilization system protein ParE
MTVRYSRQALAQIERIFDRFETESPSVATAFSRRLELLADLLNRRPSIGRRTDIVSVRVFPLKPYPYLLFYREDDAGVIVLRVRHMARGERWRAGR